MTGHLYRVEVKCSHNNIIMHVIVHFLNTHDMLNLAEGIYHNKANQIINTRNQRMQQLRNN